ncbi:MAG: glycosyltransferase [Actinomycetota bacterium]|nr:glycosyltransferase [Actinomycetota bacterium]
MTRIVMVAGTYQPERCGMAHYTERLRFVLGARGISSIVLTTKEAAQASKDPDVRGAVRGWGIAELPALVRAVVRAAHEADAIHVQHAAGTYGFKRAVFFLPPLLRAAGCHTPLVTTVHEYGWWEWEPRGVPKRVLETIKIWGQRRGRWDREDGFLLTGSDALITTNTHAEAAITQRLPWLSSHLHRIPLASNVDRSSVRCAEARGKARSRFGWPSDAQLIAYFGFLHPVKGIETLLKAYRRAFESRPEARLLLIGGVESLALRDEESTWYWKKLKALTTELGLEGFVAMTGYVPEEDASRLLSAADIGVLPFNEGVTLKSGTLLTLFAHGLPVVATRPEPPEPDLVDGEIVKLVQRRDVTGLTSALLGLLTDASLRVRLGKAGRVYAWELTWPSIAARHVEVYESVLKKRAKVTATWPGSRQGASRAERPSDSLEGGSTKG